ncbi:MAG: septum formation initiator family protein [Candidatus Margulisiibacteriota bacterium]
MRFNIWNLLLIFLIFYLLYLIREDVLKYHDLTEQMRSLDKNFIELKTENARKKILVDKVARTYFVEREAREKLGYVKKGEIAYQICR